MHGIGGFVRHCGSCGEYYHPKWSNFTKLCVRASVCSKDSGLGSTKKREHVIVFLGLRYFTQYVKSSWFPFFPYSWAVFRSVHGPHFHCVCVSILTVVSRMPVAWEVWPWSETAGLYVDPLLAFEGSHWFPWWLHQFVVLTSVLSVICSISASLTEVRWNLQGVLI